MAAEFNERNDIIMTEPCGRPQSRFIVDTRDNTLCIEVFGTGHAPDLLTEIPLDVIAELLRRHGYTVTR